MKLCRNDSQDLVYECELDSGGLSFLFVVFGLLCGASQSLWQTFPEPLGDRSLGIATIREKGSNQSSVFSRQFVAPASLPFTVFRLPAPDCLFTRYCSSTSGCRIESGMTVRVVRRKGSCQLSVISHCPSVPGLLPTTYYPPLTVFRLPAMFSTQRTQ